MAALQSTTPFIAVDGPSGTGKTTLACSHAAGLIRDKLAEPGNKKFIIGFLPDTLENKLRSFLMPIFDCFAEFGNYANMLLAHGVIKKVVPALAFMRSRTFKNCFIIIADEMKNATPGQLKIVFFLLGWVRTLAW